jgi:hypothetical protein
MKTIHKITVAAISLVFMLIADVPLLPVQLVPDAEAIFGVRRRMLRRGVIIGASAGAASESAAMSSQEAVTAQQQSATAKQQTAAAAPPAPPAASAGKPLPLGTVVPTLPTGCTATPVSGVEYYYCGGNFYRAVFQGNTLVYVTAKPE